MTDQSPIQVNRGSLDRLMTKITEARGVDLGLYRRAYVERRVAARLRTLGMRTYRQYSDLLDQDPSEYQELLNTITINVTDFFRDQAMWNVLKTRVLKEIVVRKKAGRNKTIRIWSAGCSTGEEPYSAAMLLLDTLGLESSNYLISVTASDLDPVALAKAERGVYDNTELRRIPAGYQVRFTRGVGDSQFEIAPEVRRLVRFQRINLFEPAPFRVMDLIMCRNVFIYFDRDQQARVLENFWNSMARGGYLVLGRSEKLSSDVAARLEMVDGRERVYKKPARP